MNDVEDGRIVNMTDVVFLCQVSSSRCLHEFSISEQLIAM